MKRTKKRRYLVQSYHVAATPGGSNGMEEWFVDGKLRVECPFKEKSGSERSRFFLL
jgi:hypothetical protein